MSTSKVFAGTSYNLPNNREPKGWGGDTALFLQAVADKALTIAGGSFALTADLNLGTNFGIIAPYFKSASSNISATGVLRFANNEGIGWRNAANSADLILKVNASNLLDFNGSTVATLSNKLSAFAATTSAELITVISDETGSGPLVFGTSPTFTTPTIDDGALFLHETTVATPSSGRLAVFAKNDNRLYTKDSSGIETQVGTGSGSIAVNYFGSNANCEETADGVLPTGWAQFNDGASATPIDGTGGSAVSQVTFLASSTSPIRGSKSFVLTKDANNRQGVGYSYAFTIANTDKAVSALTSFEFLTDTNYASSDAGIWLFDATNSVLVTPRLTSISKADAGGKWRSDYALTSGTSYRWIIYIASTNALAWTMKIDTMINTTDPSYVQGPASTAWKSYTPSGAVTTNVTYTGRWKQSVTDIDLRINMAFSGVNTQGNVSFTAAQLLNGLGLTVDSTALATGAKESNAVGTWDLIDDSATNGSYSGLVYRYTDGSFYLTYPTGATTASTVNTNTNQPITFAANDNLSIRISIPITEFAGAATFGPSVQPEYLSSSFSSFAAYRGSDGTALPTTTPAGTIETVSAGAQPFQYAQQVGDFVRLEIQIGGTGPWLPNSISQQVADLNFDGTNWIGIGLYWDGTAYQIARGKYRSGGSALWSSMTAGTRYRIPKASAAAWTGVQLANSSNTGFVAPRKGQYSMTVTSSAAGWVTNRAVGIYYQDQDGNHRLKFNIHGTITSKTLISDNILIAGVVFKNVAGYIQSFAAWNNGGFRPTAGAASPNTGTLSLDTQSSTGTTILSASGDLELDSKPTWA